MTDSSNPRTASGQALTATDPADAADWPDEDDPAPSALAPSDYDPADYRWVPVRRRPRLDGWTEEKQRRFIETLADTGLVNLAARAVGMSRESAYQLRRSGHHPAFTRAWDAARHHAGGLIEDIVFERAILGVEQEVYDGNGEVVGARLVHDNRLLKYLLSHLKPDRYGGQRAVSAAPPVAPDKALEESLRAMEPALPAPPEQLMSPDDLEAAVELAEVSDGKLPHFLNEQRAPRTDAQIAAEAAAARSARGEAAIAKREAGHELTDEEFADECFYLDPASNSARRRRPRA
ncbi:MAG: hypothetical protein V4459_06455 [Pseudomonadota bacterium]